MLVREVLPVSAVLLVSVCVCVCVYSLIVVFGVHWFSQSICGCGMKLVILSGCISSVGVVGVV